VVACLVKNSTQPTRATHAASSFAGTGGYKGHAIRFVDLSASRRSRDGIRRFSACRWSERLREETNAVVLGLRERNSTNLRCDARRFADGIRRREGQ